MTSRRVEACGRAVARHAATLSREHGRAGGATRHERSPVALQGLAAGSGAAHAREQPAPRRRRESRRARRLRRDRQGRAQLAELPRDRARAPAAGRRGDAARAVGQAGGGVRDPRARAAGADRELEPGPRLGQLGRVPQARRGRADHVRADDRRLLDLHREPGDPPGDLRDVRRGRAQALRRHAGRASGRHRRPGRHGRRPAAVDHDAGRHGAVRRGRPAADRAAHPRRVPRRARGRSRRRAAPARCGAARAARAVDRTRRQRRRGPSGARAPGGRRSMS